MTMKRPSESPLANAIPNLVEEHGDANRDRDRFADRDKHEQGDDTARHLSIIRSWVGRPYSQIRCWDLVVAAFALRGIAIPSAYAEALERRMLRTVTEPEPWDIIPICNHELQIVNHAGLYFSPVETFHSFENAGAVSIPLDRQPWFDRIARTRDGRRGFLRLR
jgi:hypothetical protein